MQLKGPDEIITGFVKNIRRSWEIILILCLMLYGATFIYHMMSLNPVRNLSYLKFLDTGSFVLAIGLAIWILRLKRKYFSLRYFRKQLENIYEKAPGSDENQLTRVLTRDLSPKLHFVWYLGGLIIVIGVVFYWWTYESRNMNIYFIVGLYSLMMNYPRKDLFYDIPFLVHELAHDPESTSQTPDQG